MLYNPEWDHRELLTVENLIAWLETQDPTRRYDFTDAQQCLIGRYLFNMGAKRIEMLVREIPSPILCAVNWCDRDKWTYGAALEWDNGKQVGVGQVIGNVLAVACLTKGRTAILAMNINPDGSLSGKWSRRTDRGYKGTETWKKT